ncbi:integrin beta-7 isoform X2 [Denticeps clupeoides]|uniref:integrin beta-7 isoform X2 n=1 Tax=Denticeps clupeoides TaxID=299321 RepID=UPI0010A4803B|nr:integrin beta-7 isoform X2 [Denticeps clupeoides]
MRWIWFILVVLGDSGQKRNLGEPFEFNVQFKRARGYPIDLFYLMDLSFSMKDDLDKIKNLGQDILSTLESFTQDKRIGFGSFVDKVSLPYSSMIKARRHNPCPSRMENCQPAFTFRNILPLTEWPEKFKKEVSKQRISGNLDSPEAGLEAILQATVCQKELGWRNVTRILVYTSDDTFHLAGDGRLAGIHQPHDGRCHLDINGTYNGMLLDYPSVGHLSRLLQDANMQLIFAVTEEIFPAYKALSELIPQSVVGILKKDSSNVVQLISEAYRNLSSTVVLEHKGPPQGMSVMYHSACSGASLTWSTQVECRGVKPEDDAIEFTVRLNASHCLEQRKELEFRVQGVRDVLRVSVETFCFCECDDVQEMAFQCKEHGTLICGVCSCNDTYQGQFCECEQQGESKCHGNSAQECSGHGRCECGECVCEENYRHTHCECDDNSCPHHAGKMCNGKGNCDCGECKCEEGFMGAACECSGETTGCVGQNGLQCSAQGVCKCNQCFCNKTVTGEHCDRIVNPCNTAVYRECMLCINSEQNSAQCDNVCGEVRCKKQPGPQEYECSHGNLTYKVELDNSGHFFILYSELPRRIDKTYVIIGSSVSGIILIGILVIVVYRLLLELYDIREYHSFLHAQEETDWKNTHNPLFKGATTTVKNPMHSQDG